MCEQLPNEVPLSSSLDPSEISSHPLARQSRAQYAMHSRTWRHRARVIDAMIKDNTPSMGRRAGKLGMCCISPTIFVQKSKLPICVADRCRDRMCPTCQAFRAGEVRRKLEACLNRCSSVRMLTLTMKHAENDVGKCVDEIIEAFKRLRVVKAWKQHVRGGAFIIETTTGATGEHWHVHMHVLIEGVYWDQRDVQAAWSTAVGSQAICDIRAIHDRNNAVRYVTKYVTKSFDAEKWSDEQLCEYAKGMHRRRLMNTFGKWHSVKIDQLNDPMTAVPKDSIRVPVSLLLSAIEQNEVNINACGPQLGLLGKVWRNMMEPYRSTEWSDAVIGAHEHVHALSDWILAVTEEMRRISFDEVPPTRPKTHEPNLPWL